MRNLNWETRDEMTREKIDKTWERQAVVSFIPASQVAPHN